MPVLVLLSAPFLLAVIFVVAGLRRPTRGFIPSRRHQVACARKRLAERHALRVHPYGHTAVVAPAYPHGASARG